MTCCDSDQYLVNLITKFTFEKQQGLYHNKERASIWRTNYSQFFFFLSRSFICSAIDFVVYYENEID